IVTGIVVEVNVRTDQGPGTKEQGPGTKDQGPAVFKPLREVLDAGAFVPPDVVALARWTAEYYAAGVGDTISALLPPMARGARADAHKTVRIASITAAGTELLTVRVDAHMGLAGQAGLSLGSMQREALDLLSGSPAGIATAALSARGIATDAIARLARRGYISFRQDRVDRDPFRGRGSGSDPDQIGIHPRSDLE